MIDHTESYKKHGEYFVLRVEGINWNQLILINRHLNLVRLLVQPFL